MKNLMLFLAAGLFGLALTSPASAQVYVSGGYGYGYGYQPALGYGMGYGPAYSPSFNGLTANYGAVGPGYAATPYYPSYQYGTNYGYGGISYYPGRYVAPHYDYNSGGRRYAVTPGPFGPQVSPFPHRH